MTTVEPIDPHADMLGFWAFRSMLKHARSPRGGGAPASPAESASQPSAAEDEAAPLESRGDEARSFTDADIDVLLKKAGIEVTPNHRQVARFLLSHRLELSRELFDLAQELFPKGVPAGLQAEAFIAALSKLPVAEAGQGTTILMSALTAQPHTLMGLLHEIRGAWTDLLAETYNRDGFPAALEPLRAAIEAAVREVAELIGAGLPDQLRGLVERREWFLRLYGQWRFAGNLETLAGSMQGPPDELFQKLLSRIRSLARAGADMLLADAILSREDVHHHLREHGACHSLGVEIAGMSLPCRIWVHDRDHPAARIMEGGRLVIYFRFSTREIGLLEGRASVEGERVELTFMSAHASVRGLLEQERARLEERFAALGYVLGQRVEAAAPPRDELAEGELPARHEPVTHLDAKA